jgi:hypothetical protein
VVLRLNRHCPSSTIFSVGGPASTGPRSYPRSILVLPASVKALVRWLTTGQKGRPVLSSGLDCLCWPSSGAATGS